MSLYQVSPSSKYIPEVSKMSEQARGEPTGDRRKLEDARCQVDKAKAVARQLHAQGYDARPELGLPPDASHEGVKAALAIEYAHLHGETCEPRSWAEYQWMAARAERDELFAKLRLLRLETGRSDRHADV